MLQRPIKGLSLSRCDLEIRSTLPKIEVSLSFARSHSLAHARAHTVTPSRHELDVR